MTRKLIEGLKFYKYFHNITFIDYVASKFIPISARKNWYNNKI